MTRLGRSAGAERRSRLGLFLPSLGGGGAERVTLNLARGVLAHGFPVDLVLVNAAGAYSDSVPDGVRVVDLAGRRTRAAMPGLIRYLREENPSGLLSVMNHANVVAIWAAALAGFKGNVLVAEHSELLPTSRSAWQLAFNASLRLSYPRATKVIAVSHGVKRSLVANARVAARHIEVIYNPVIGHELRSADRRRPAGLPADNVPNVVGMGRLVPEKDFPTLLRAFARLREHRPARLLILGEGPERGALQDLVRELRMEREVSLPGFVSNAYDYLAHADLFALSSQREGLPTVVIEALALGTRVVATDCPSGPREILADGTYGPLVPVGDSAALAAAMLEALTAAPPEVPGSWLNQFAEGHSVRRYLQAFGVAEASRSMSPSGHPSTA